MTDSPWSVQTRYLILVIILLLLALLVYYARPLLSPLVIAALLAYVMEPMVSLAIRKTRRSRKVVVPVIYALFLVSMAAIPAIFTPVLLAQADDFRRELVAVQNTLQSWVERANVMGIPLLPLGEDGETQDALALLYDPQRIFGVLVAATENIAWILITLVTTFYFLLDGERLHRALVSMAPLPYRKDVERLIAQVQTIWQAYLRGQLLLMFAIGLLTWIVAVTVGLRGALLIGILAGALDVIPSLGPAVAMLIAGVIAYLEGSTYLAMPNTWFALLVVGLLMGVQAFENVWLRPRILSQSLRLHPAIVFVAIVGALSLAGVVAALVIVPLISTFEVLGRYLFRRIWGEDPWPEAGSETQPDQVPALPGVH